ncbi:MAG: VanW family protein [Thermoleophilia bacterium]
MASVGSDRPMRVYRAGRRPWWHFAIVATVLAVVGLLLAGYFLSQDSADRIPPDVRVAGIEVGGLAVDEATALVRQAVTAERRRTIELVYPGGELETTPGDLGVAPRVDAAVERARSSRGRFSRLWARLGLAGAVDVSLDLSARPRRVRTVVDRLAEALERPMQPASVERQGDEIVVVPARVGLELDRSTVYDRLLELPQRVELPVTQIQPTVTDDEARRAQELAQALVSSPPAIVHEGTRLTLSADVIREALRFEPSSTTTIAVALDAEVLRPSLEEAFAGLGRPPVDARFRVRGERVEIVPAVQGSALDVETTVRQLVPNAGSVEVPAVFTPVDAGRTTEDARAMGIVELVSEFTTPYPCCQPRVRNIQRAATLLDGTIIEPGAELSLNEALGERTRERGFVEAPMIGADGRLVDAVGGGVSQVATTIFNAAFFAGLELIQHTPHSFYISRYPMGREATISWGGPELIFRNDWPQAVLVKIRATDTSIRVRFYSTVDGRRVRTTTSEPYDEREPTVRRVVNEALAPGTERVVQAGGVRGFSVDYTRVVEQDGEVRRRERFHVEYQPEDTIVEVGPGPAAETAGDAVPGVDPAAPPPDQGT